MPTSLRLTLFLFTALMLLGASSSANAQAEGAQGSSSFQETLAAGGLAGCSVSAPPLVFSVPLGTSGPVRSTTSVMIACTPGVDFAVGIDRGDNSLGINRRMRNTSGPGFIRYEIYSDAARRRPWSDRKNQMVAGNSGASGQTTLTAYGEIANIGQVGSGSYSDSVTVSIDF